MSPGSFSNTRAPNGRAKPWSGGAPGPYKGGLSVLTLGKHDRAADRL